MTGHPSYDPHRFQSTVPYYVRYRLDYPERLIRRVAALSGLKPGGRVLDLGCGPGFLALSFARLGMAVTAVDPEPEMLEAATAAAAKAGLAVDVRAGSSFEMPAGLGPFDLVVMGRAFHWTDRAVTLAVLDRLIVPGGGVALFDDEHLKAPENRWRQELDAVSGRYGADQAPHRVQRAAADYRRHESILLESPFNHIETAGEIVSRMLGVDDIIGYARSLSVTADRTLGDRSAAFETDLRRALAALSPDGRFREVAEMRALIARRP